MSLVELCYFRERGRRPDLMVFITSMIFVGDLFVRECIGAWRYIMKGLTCSPYPWILFIAILHSSSLSLPSRENLNISISSDRQSRWRPRKLLGRYPWIITPSTILTLGVQSQYITDLPSIIQVRLRQFHTRTLSSTMTINVLEESQPLTFGNPIFLEISNPRFSRQFGRYNGIDSGTKTLENAYHDLVKSGVIGASLHDLNHIPDYKFKTEEEWNDAQIDAYMVDVLSDLSDSEVAVHNALHEHQGRLIPRAFAGVDLDILPPRLGPQLHDKEMEAFTA